MPRPARFISEKGLPIEGAVQAPSSLARKDFSIASAIGGVGQQITKIGDDERRIKAELERRNLAAIDANSKVTAKSFYDIADKEFEAWKETNSTDTWEEKFALIYTKADQRAASLDMTEEARASMKAQANATKGIGFASMELERTTVNVDNAVIATSTAYETDIVNGVPPEVIGNSGAEYIDALTAKYGEEKAQEIFSKKTESSYEEKDKKTNSDLMNQAVESPDLAKAMAEVEIQRRKIGKGEISEEEVSSQQLLNVIQLANSRNIERERNAKDAKIQAQKDVENEMYNGLNDGTKTLKDVTGSKVLDAAQKRRLTDDYTSMNKMDIVNNWPLTDSDDVVQGLNTKLTDQSSGLFDIQQMNASINKAAATGKLTKETRDKMRSQAKKGGLDAIDEQANASALRVKNALVGRLSDREARFKVRAAGRELTRDEQREASSIGFLLQVSFEQLNRFNSELNKRMREVGKETLSGTDVEALSAEVWEKYKKKSDSQKIREFQEFTGQRVPKPEGFSDKVWNGASLEARAEIVTSVSNGLTNKQIMDALGK